MKTFLKILLILLGVVVAIKLFPLALAAACVIGAVALLTAVLGVSVAVVIFSVVIVAAAALSPIWVPVLLVVGIVALCRRKRPA